MTLNVNLEAFSLKTTSYKESYTLYKSTTGLQIKIPSYYAQALIVLDEHCETVVVTKQSVILSLPIQFSPLRLYKVLL